MFYSLPFRPHPHTLNHTLIQTDTHTHNQKGCECCDGSSNNPQERRNPDLSLQFLDSLTGVTGPNLPPQPAILFSETRPSNRSSDQNLLHLLPVCRPLVGRQPAVTCTVSRGSEEAEEALRDGVQSTMWDECCEDQGRTLFQPLLCG